MNIYDLISPNEMDEALTTGLVRSQEHPVLPLTIYNYTEKAQFSRTWNSATVNSRGLIVNSVTHEIVARPFPKFFNHGESQAPVNLHTRLDEPAEVTDKMDGSLGIMYFHEGMGPLIATRGSFTSDQAVHANQILFRKYPNFEPPAGWTLLFEIIYPENRIVVDYAGQDDLVLLGAVHIGSGATMGPGWPTGWSGPRTEVMTPGTLREALSVDPRAGKEGVVVRFIFTDEQVKIKQDEYVQLHRIVTGLNEKAVWERVGADDLAGNHGDSAIYENIPDELHQWVSDVADRLVAEFAAMEAMVEEAWVEIQGLEQADPFGLLRPEFAKRAKMFHPWVKTCLFLKYDGKDYDKFLWEKLKPAGGKGPHSG